MERHDRYCFGIKVCWAWGFDVPLTIQRTLLSLMGCCPKLNFRAGIFGAGGTENSEFKQVIFNGVPWLCKDDAGQKCI